MGGWLDGEGRVVQVGVTGCVYGGGGEEWGNRVPRGPVGSVGWGGVWVGFVVCVCRKEGFGCWGRWLR